ncbi:MAG: hypothetical protein AAF413_03135 [Patescibacteria group bacterium]
MPNGESNVDAVHTERTVADADAHTEDNADAHTTDHRDGSTELLVSYILALEYYY